MENDSKCAISLIQQFLGSQILSSTTPTLLQCGRSPREQAIELFKFIKDHRIAQVTLRSDIDNDLTLIKKAESFSEALDIIGIVTQLNFELITMDPLFGKSDDELISCLISKMIAPCFQSFIMMVVGRNQISVDLPVLFAVPVPAANRLPKINWSEFNNLIKQYQNIDRQQGTHTVLSSHASTATSYAAKESADSPMKRRFEELQQELSDSKKRYRNLQNTLSRNREDNFKNRDDNSSSASKANRKSFFNRDRKETPDKDDARPPFRQGTRLDSEKTPPRRFNYRRDRGPRANSALAEDIDQDDEDTLEIEDQGDDQDAQKDDAYDQYTDDRY